MTLSHRPRRPCWLCQHCDEPWPCETERKTLHLEAEGDRLYLSIYYGLYYADAISDGLAPGSALYDRFFGWMDDDTGPR